MTGACTLPCFKWGPHLIDRFASYFNTQLPRFNSRFWNPTSEAVGAFTCNWGGENNWWCPPMYLIPEVLGHAKATHAKGTLIVPQWSSPPFWPKFFFTDSKVKQNVVATKVIEKGKIAMCCGRSGDNLFTGKSNAKLHSEARFSIRCWQCQLKTSTKKVWDVYAITLMTIHYHITV